jgi:hypothetical protein
MGRKLKFGEKTKWVSVRVPESKVKIARVLVREFVEILFIHLRGSGWNVLETFMLKIWKLFRPKGYVKFRSFREFATHADEKEKVQD